MKHILPLLTVLLISCGQNATVNVLSEKDFETEISGRRTHLYTISNESGSIAQFTDYGGRWVSMWVPDKDGIFRDVVLGFDTIKGYRTAVEGYHGAITGRVCGRIRGGSFTMDGVEYKLANNDIYGKPVKNHLHGGAVGYNRKVWHGTVGIDSTGNQYVEFSYLSPDGEEGYPGNLDIMVRYTLTRNNVMRIEYKADTDKSTVVNITNHAFFNLSGNPAHSVDDQIVMINADHYVACDQELVPTGEILSVNGTPIDFTTPKAIGKELRSRHPEILYGKGYAIAYAVNVAESGLTHSAFLKDSQNGIRMDVWSNQPSLQFYNAWLMNGTDIGKGGIPYHNSAGVVLESQGFPDAPNHKNFPSIKVTPQKSYYHIAEYRFSVER